MVQLKMDEMISELENRTIEFPRKELFADTDIPRTGDIVISIDTRMHLEVEIKT